MCLTLKVGVSPCLMLSSNYVHRVNITDVFPVFTLSVNCAHQVNITDVSPVFTFSSNCVYQGYTYVSWPQMILCCPYK